MRLRFADVVFDSRLRRVTRGDKLVALSPKGYALLELLIRNRPAPVSHETVYAALWPNTFVEPGNVHNLIRELRTALGDEAKSLIRTVHRVGYAFVADDAAETLDDSPYVIIAGNDEVRLRDGENVIGRDPQARIVLDSAGVSRQHARIVVHGDTALLEDLGSKNGTFLCTRRVNEPTALTPGDEIVVGRSRLVFTVARAVEATITL